MPSYPEGGAPEVWVLNLRDRQLEVSTRGGTEVYAAAGAIVRTVQGVAVDIGEVFARAGEADQTA